MAQIKLVLERRFRARLGGDDPVSVADDVTEAFRAIAHEDMVPSVYDWLAGAADRADLVEFLALEGGPDADFDDLVALCQIGLSGLPKLTLARQLLGRDGTRGDSSARAHRAAPRHGRRRSACRADPHGSPARSKASERRALNGYLATNRALQPEMLGSLGLLECQAGPRCRRVVAGAAPPRRPARPRFPFYEEHATADPRHGKDWIDGTLAPVVVDHPEWALRILRGRAVARSRERAVLRRDIRHASGWVERAA